MRYIKKTYKNRIGRSLIPKGGCDNIYTPDVLAKRIVYRYRLRLKGRILEPCSGGGAFVRALKENNIRCTSLELKKGKDFFRYNKPVDWIITNPPYSKVRSFLLHSYKITKNILFLVPTCHILSLKARRRDMKEAGFGIKKVLECDTPKTFPPSGFQLGVVHLQKGFDDSKMWGTL